jgi:hypothetical protein
MTENERRRPTRDAVAAITPLSLLSDGTRRCGCCGGWLSPRCPVCAGEPDDGVTIEHIARGVAAVDRAARDAA